MIHLLILAGIALPLLLVLRVVLLLPGQQGKKPQKPRALNETCSLGVFLGSGGHTSEMRTLLTGIDFKRYTPRTYVYCPGDDMSLRLIKELEVSKGSSISDYALVPLPRARRVAQPLLSTIRTSIITLIAALYLFFLHPLWVQPRKPWVDVLVVNGPGTCVLLVAVCWIRRILGLSYTRIIYVESFARVKSLSLSAKLLKPFVDTFVTQWPQEKSSMEDIAMQRENRKVHKGWLV